MAMTMTSGADSAYLYDMLSDAGLEHEYPRREGTASAWHLIGSTLAASSAGAMASSRSNAARWADLAARNVTFRFVRAWKKSSARVIS